MALPRSALLCKLNIKRSARPFTKKTQFVQMGWSVFLLGPDLGPARARARARARSAPGPGWAGPWTKLYSQNSTCMQGGVEVWRGEDPHPALLSADAGTVGNCVDKLSARPIGVLTLGKVAAPSSPKHLLSHFPRPLFANSFELSFA